MYVGVLYYRYRVRLRAKTQTKTIALTILYFAIVNLSLPNSFGRTASVMAFACASNDGIWAASASAGSGIRAIAGAAAALSFSLRRKQARLRAQSSVQAQGRRKLATLLGNSNALVRLPLWFRAPSPCTCRPTRGSRARRPACSIKIRHSSTVRVSQVRVGKGRPQQPCIHWHRYRWSSTLCACATREGSVCGGSCN